MEWDIPMVASGNLLHSYIAMVHLVWLLKNGDS